MAGRKPLGPELAHHLEGSDRAKERLEVILETIAGRTPIAQACERLGIGEAMFHRLRIEVLQAGLNRLEPRRIGRPPRETSPEASQITDLNRRLTQLEQENKVAELRLEVAQILAAPKQGETVKKTNEQAQRRRQRKQRFRPRKKRAK